ncbi:F-box protein KIB4-like [Lolium perenne]|uniref:F-box protein KIB4-like n=1 Tax=Lolium perenne TaxID=4522 RepID=UPI0021F61A7B|nr:uncharacterized protein LOC127303490 [Lolium perenne]
MRRHQTKPAVDGLAPDMLANIHGRLTLLDRLALAAVFRGAFKPEAPCLFLPGETPETATLYSLADRGPVVVRATGLDHVVLGSSDGGGWLVTADDRARMHLVNPVTGERHALPDITTIPHLFTHGGGASFTLHLEHFACGPPYGYGYGYGYGDRRPQGRLTTRAESIREIFYHKVVLSDSSPRPTAMLITGSKFGVAAFAMGDGGAWRLAAPSPSGIEDAIYYKGQFYSITYSGDVEVWEHAADLPTRSMVAPTLLKYAERKYLVAALDGRLMVVLEKYEETMDEYRWTCSFNVHVLDAGGEEWEETDDIGDAALFVGLNSCLCVSTGEHPELSAGCVYYTEDGDRSPLKDATTPRGAVYVQSQGRHGGES